MKFDPKTRVFSFSRCRRIRIYTYRVCPESNAIKKKKKWLKMSLQAFKILQSIPLGHSYTFASDFFMRGVRISERRRRRPRSEPLSRRFGSHRCFQNGHLSGWSWSSGTKRCLGQRCQAVLGQELPDHVSTAADSFSQPVEHFHVVDRVDCLPPRYEFRCEPYPWRRRSNVHGFHFRFARFCWLTAVESSDRPVRLFPAIFEQL